MRPLALALIRIYQRFLSPWKGFHCAYRVHTGRAGCSALGFRAIRRFGVLGGLRLLRQRTALCGVAHRRFGPAVFRPPVSQRGDCDVGGCDLPGDGGDLPGKRCLSQVFDCGCDFANCDGPDRKRKKEGKDKSGRQGRAREEYLPPRPRQPPVQGV